MKYKNIIIMSNGNFGIPTIKYLIKNQKKYYYNINCIITTKNKIKKKKNFIKNIAKKYKINLIYSEYIYKKKNIKKIKKINPDIQLLISFKIIKYKLWKIPKIGTINIHPSLLPLYKGSSPINWVLINNEKKTGLTSFFINDDIDGGNIILQKEIYIKKNYNYKKLKKIIIKKTKKFTLKSILKIINNKFIINNNNNNNKIKKIAPKINNFYSKIFFLNYNKKKILNLIKGLSSKKPVWCFINKNKNIFFLKIYKINIFNIKIFKKYNKIGKIILINKKVFIKIKDGYMQLLICKISNKKKIKGINIYNSLINFYKKKLFCF
ncbi:MAG: hypothetical protein NHG02_00915 [Candidatus Shikimatogenerans bostrichidophilus]|nr:MAG: hypothetical protein NHG02_00915 [Candidatus Shikimatogenerans bostrichidophilus]